MSKAHNITAVTSRRANRARHALSVAHDVAALAAGVAMIVALRALTLR